MRAHLILVVAAVLLAGCLDTAGGRPESGAAEPAFPPDRSAWQALPAAAQAAHARALHELLEDGKLSSISWATGGASGRIALERLAPARGTFCGVVADRIESGAAASKVRDMVCWGDGWAYVRDPQERPVLAPAFAEEDRVYTVRSGGRLSDVARVTDTDLAALERLNPAYPERLAAGTKVLLP